MALSISLPARASMLDGLEAFLEVGAGSITFTLYQGNTSLAVFPLTTPSAAVLDALLLTAGAVNSTGTEVAGTVNRFILTNQNSATAVTGTVGALGSGADIEVPGLTITAAATQTLNALVFRMDALGNLTVEASLALQ